jgi:16S rRNA (guanine527-N7)-methyltransferase
MDVDSEAWQRTVIAGADKLGVKVSMEQAQAMSVHAEGLLQWNRITNLTAITDSMAVAIKHHVDSLVLVNRIPKGARVLDAGAGGGFPGLPIKIARPDLSIILVDSVRKKISFLNYTIGKLNLRDIKAVHGRLEDLALQSTYRGKFDMVTCRALSALEEFAALSLPFLSPNGSLIAMKGPQAEHDHEIDDIADDDTLVLAGTRFKIHIHRYTLPVLGDQRRLVRLTRV